MSFNRGDLRSVEGARTQKPKLNRPLGPLAASASIGARFIKRGLARRIGQRGQLHGLTCLPSKLDSNTPTWLQLQERHFVERVPWTWLSYNSTIFDHAIGTLFREVIQRACFCHGRSHLTKPSVRPRPGIRSRILFAGTGARTPATISHTKPRSDVVCGRRESKISCEKLQLLNCFKCLAISPYLCLYDETTIHAFLSLDCNPQKSVQ